LAVEVVVVVGHQLQMARLLLGEAEAVEPRALSGFTMRLIWERRSLTL
jgi:hypothetical protein